MRLRKKALDLQTVLFVPIASFIHSSGLLHFDLEQLLNATLYDFSALLHSTSKRSQRLFKFSLHLGSNARMCFPHSLYLPADYIKRHS
jgi:hypothetical protein